MRIGINTLFLIPDKVGGTETYARELIKSLEKIRDPKDTYYLLCNLENRYLFKNNQGVKVITLPVKASLRPLRLVAEQLLLPFYTALLKIKVILSLGYTSPWFSTAKSVVTIHDLNWHYHPEDFGWFSRKIWEITTRLSAKTSNHVITDSTASANSIKEVLKVPAEKCTTILHAPPEKIELSKKEITKRLKKLNIQGQYLFTVISGHPHKNLITLLCAFKDLVLDFPKLKLVVCGLSGRADKNNQAYIKKADLQKKVKILGFVDRKDLAALYQSCTAFVFPSAYEGFGYPVIEAMQYQAPVVSSNAFSLRQVVGKAGLLVNPYDANEFTKAIKKVLGSKKLANHLINQGNRRVKKLQWKDTAQKTLNILHQA